ncbi:MAG: acyl dehydratase [Acidobacteria bacterium]|nr:MAG: acyl dehydratase [Acidobacteriota bacterium]
MTAERVAKSREYSADGAALAKYAEASGDHNPIHLDPDAARKAGLEDCVVHGMLIMAWAASVAAEVVGGAQNLKSLRMRFKSPLYVGVQATVTAEAVEATGEQIDVRVTVSDPSGLTCASGSGIATARRFH